MKIAYLLLCLVVIQGIEFESLQKAIDFDPASIDSPNCKTDDEYTNTYEAFFPWITILEEGEVEMQEDHSVLSQAKEKIIQAREFIESLDEELQQEKEKEPENQTNESSSQVQDAQTEKTGEAVEEQVKQEEKVDEDDEEDPFGWGTGEIPQLLVHKKERKAHKNTHAFIQIMNGNKLSKFKSKISKLISMATEMQDNQDEDAQKRRQRKLELCDEIIDELTDMILFLEKVMNDYDYQNEIYELFKKKQQQIQEVATNCGQRVISYQDVSLIEEKKSQEKKKIQHQIKSKRRNPVSFLQIVIDDEESQQHQLEYQKQILQSQGMLGFLRASGKQVKLIQ
ncbi:unnamed protein product (macronuclear) [Paramecium tetraurelia]|uniref:Uncharacterized protein n=1 Tax=Paramecium tetraurelia TaxID=5888 RepID=A0E908_PARTE|nr:uncharacterized protein GSPATT00024506001 [Paramecium tetraurelia]CAK91775.1 unnamed protein product [Paramecium tetraurelia]|eukprot:XP_001459172.1 hypothetical protein (macronuclear) [Paramecium tetraurelia strain d4-2]